MFAHLNGRRRDDGVQMVRCGNDNGIDVLLLLIEQLPPIRVEPGVRMIPARTVAPALVSIAERHDLFFPAMLEIAPALPAHAYAGNAELFPGVELPRPRFGLRAQRAQAAGHQ